MKQLKIIQAQTDNFSRELCVTEQTNESQDTSIIIHYIIL